MIRRTYHMVKELKDRGPYAPSKEIERFIPVPEAEANIVSSLVEGTKDIHAPALDLDFPARLIPSSTAGHFHLYLDVPLTWRDYKRVLKALAKSGLIEKGYYRAAKARKATHLRKEGVYKAGSVKVL